jgi:hypothetical protein
MRSAFIAQYRQSREKAFREKFPVPSGCRREALSVGILVVVPSTGFDRVLARENRAKLVGNMAELADIKDWDGLPAPRRHWAIAAIWLGMAMAVLDGAIANVALPATLPSGVPSYHCAT